MSVTPGYDFSTTEQVTAAKLAAWLLAATDPAVAGGYTGEYVGLTAITSVSLSAEGNLLYDNTRGTLEVQTRWGPVPVIGRGMFSRRVWFRAAGAPNSMLAFSGILCMGENVRQTLPISTCSSTNWTANFGIAHNVQNLYSGNPSTGVYGPCVIQPTQGLVGAGDLTCISCLSSANHHLIQLRGFTPLAATHITAATYPAFSVSGQWITILGTSAYDTETLFHRCHTVSHGADFSLAGRVPVYFGPCISSHTYPYWYKYTL